MFTHSFSVKCTSAKGLIINLENAPIFQFPHVGKNHYHLFKQYVHIRENAPYFMLFIHMFGKYLEPRKENIRYPTPNRSLCKNYVHVM